MDKTLSPVERARIRDRTTELHAIHKLRAWTPSEKAEWENLNERWFESAAAEIRAANERKKTAHERKKNDDARYVCRGSIEGRRINLWKP